MTEILTPFCPRCGQFPELVMGGGTQAFCGTDDCDVFIWNPELSAEGNLSGAQVVEFPPMEGGADD